MSKDETWREACRKLQDDGVRFESYSSISFGYGSDWVAPFLEDVLHFDSAGINLYRIARQPLPDRPDWREWCKRLRDAGVKIERLPVFEWGREWFPDSIEFYRISQQPIPSNIGEIMEELPDEVKAMPQDFDELMRQSVPIDKEQIERVRELAKDVPDEKEIPHRELQIQWHKDKLHSLETGEPMREWEASFKEDEDWTLMPPNPAWSVNCKYRRKPKVKNVTYWHCLVEGYDIHNQESKFYPVVSTGSKQHLEDHLKKKYSSGPYKISPITETTIDVEVLE